MTTGKDERGDEIVDVAHETLIRGWPRLQQWIDEDRAALRTHRRLTGAADEWKENDCDESYLYRGARLAEAEEWAETHADDMNPLERGFLEASTEARKAGRLAARRQVQRVIAGLVTGLVIISALAIFFLTADTGSWTDFRRISPGYALLAAGLMVAQWCLNALRFKILVNSLDNRVSFATSLKAFMSNIFMSAITPSQTGGGPMQIYVLNRSGVSIARAFAGCLMGAVLTVVSLLSTTLAILILAPGLRAELGRHLTGVVLAAAIVFSILASLFLLSLFR